ncbi:MAG: acyl-CoA synthetase FdrA [Bacillota bacterium]|nr:acyl-CoA synthetase FdrA [Bacillota bacterium]
MVIKSYISKNTFRDSVYLMRLSSTIREFDGVDEAEVIIGTDHNKKFLESGGLMTDEIARDAGANDLIIAVRAVDEEKAEKAIQDALTEMNKSVERENLQSEFIPRTFETAIKNLPGANIALISIPGTYVKREADKILDAGLNLMIFSDNVTLKEEIALKQKARDKGLLVMGPDCGTAIINGVPLAFSNEVRQGKIGIVAAAGTGLQEVSSLISNMGEGISHGIGTGGRDVKKSVGGITMLLGLEMLINDDSTEVIVVVSKPPDPEVSDKVLTEAGKSKKPVVVNFLGGDQEKVKTAGCIPAATLKEASLKAVNIVRGKDADTGIEPYKTPEEIINKEIKSYKSGQKRLRALFSGGTLAYEALLILSDLPQKMHTNLSYKDALKLEDVYKSVGNTIIDFGEDEFTQGRLHPMIDPALRNKRILAEARDPETAVISLDIVLGYNAHHDPAGSALEAILEARKIAEKDGRKITFTAYVCGTEDDPQKRGDQVAKLKDEGVHVFESNADAAFFTRELLKKLK